MATLPPREQQIRQSHAMLIHQVVKACANTDARRELFTVLEAARENGWAELVARIQHILQGQRDTSLLNGVDEEDRVILEAILQGLQDPASLPELASSPDASQAAPGLAQMIHAARRGDPQALHAVAFMAEQMTNTLGDMRLLGGAMKRLVDGETDLAVLCKGMSAQGRQLVSNLLEELGQLTETTARNI